MKYIMQFGVIAALAAVAEVIKQLVPLSIPASIYGLVLLFALLCSGLLKLEHVGETGSFLIEIMTLLFVPAAVGLMNSYALVRPILLRVLVLIVVTTVIVIAVTGRVTQWVMRLGKGR